MPGTREGGLKAAKTNLKRHGKDFYRIIGTEGGKRGKTGGFYVHRELASIVGAKGGSISRRGKAKK